MGEYMCQGWFTPDGVFSTGPAPGFGDHANLTTPTWAPGNVQSEDPHDSPGFDHGDKPSFGEVPPNIVTGELRSRDDSDSCGDADDDAGVDDFSDPSDFADSTDDFGDLDGDDVAQDGSFDDGGEDGEFEDDSASPAPNIVVRGGDLRGIAGALGLTPGPLSRSRLGQ